MKILALKPEMACGQGWLGSYFSRIQVQICAFYEEDRILRSKFHYWKRKLGS